MPLNLKLFDTWTEESAYFLGVLAVLGEVNGSIIKVSGRHADPKWLRRVAAILGLKKVSSGNVFAVDHKLLTQPLWDMKAKHGSVPEAVPEEMFHHFVRGMFDAGGDVSTWVVLTGKPTALRKVNARLIDMRITSSDLDLDLDENPPKLRYSGTDVQKLGAFMYKGVGDLCLQYKREAFEMKNELPGLAKNEDETTEVARSQVHAVLQLRDVSKSTNTDDDFMVC